MNNNPKCGQCGKFVSIQDIKSGKVHVDIDEECQSSELVCAKCIKKNIEKLNDAIKWPYYD